MKRCILAFIQKIFTLILPQNGTAIDKDNVMHLLNLAQRNSISKVENLWDIGFKVYSQWEEDGILNFLCDKLELLKPRILEFGSGNFEECNSRFLAEFRNSPVVVVDARDDLISSIEKLTINWKTHVYPIETWITPDSAKDIYISAINLMGVVDILSIDLDGNDYWVLKELPLDGISIIVVEYSPIFGDIASCTVPRNDIFNRTSAHSSNLYWGASLTAFIELLAVKKFTFVGTNRVGNNAFFVNSSSCPKLGISIPDGRNFGKYVDYQIREGRTIEGGLSLLSSQDRLNAISEMPIVNLKNNELSTIRNLIIL